MIIALVVIFSFTLGIKIAVLRNLLIMKQKCPEKEAYYNTRIKLAKMFIMPSAILLVAILVFMMWTNVE